MRTYNGTIAAGAAALMILLSLPVGADDAPPYVSATEAYRQGIAAIKSGDTENGLTALGYAAERGVLGAQLKLARLYAAGNGVPKDDAKAFLFYEQIANQRADISPLSPVAKYVAEAFVGLGQYYLDGIPAYGLRQDPERSADLFRHAASYFGDADAQYALARLYLVGTGVDKNIGLAVNWLAQAAKKQQAAAQATLGELLWHGAEEVRPRPAKGLALILLAHANAKAEGKEPKWIEELYRQAQASADMATLKEAQNLMPELGGPAKEPAIAGATPAASGKLLVPASSGAALNAVTGPAAGAETVVSSEQAPGAAPPVQLGASTAGGETAPKPAGTRFSN
jgi:uncharacterized protein